MRIGEIGKLPEKLLDGLASTIRKHRWWIIVEVSICAIYLYAICTAIYGNCRTEKALPECQSVLQTINKNISNTQRATTKIESLRNTRLQLLKELKECNDSNLQDASLGRVP